MFLYYVSYLAVLRRQMRRMTVAFCGEQQPVLAFTLMLFLFCKLLHSLAPFGGILALDFEGFKEFNES